jgi:hypothetical protein
MPRLRYIEEGEKTPYTRELIESAKRTGAPDPRVVSLMTRGKLGIARQDRPADRAVARRYLRRSNRELGGSPFRDRARHGCVRVWRGHRPHRSVARRAAQERCKASSRQRRPYRGSRRFSGEA